tara:strand:- start:16 stop:1161 length:1146 start_codon:yes stop_codon:yes gene_type:complete
MNVPFRVTLINAHARSGRPVLGDRAGAAAFAAGLKATVLEVEEVQSPSNPQETEVMYVVTFDQPEYWIRRGLNEVSSLTKRWPASFFNTIEDDGVRPPGYVDHNIGDGQNRQADTGGRRKTRKRKRKQRGGHHLYKRLGVSKYASQKQIRKAFKTLKKKRKATKKVREAYKILSNKKSRKQYNNRYRKAVKRGGKRKTRRRKGGNENCYSFRDPKDLKLCNEIHQAAQYYNTSRPERLSKGQKIARYAKNRLTRRNNPKPENQQQVAQQKQATFLEFKDKLQAVLAKLKENEDNIRADLIETIEGPNDPTGEKQRVLEAEYDEAFSKTNEKLMLMKEINANLSSDKSPLPAQIEKARNDYSNRGKVPLAPNYNYSNFNVAY